MTDLGLLVGTAGALGGVALGAWITAASQRVLAREAHHRTLTQGRQEAYVEYLAAYRNFRRFLLAEDVEVHIVERPEDPGRVTPVIAGSTKYWETIETATARIYIVASDKPILASARDVQDAFYSIAEARAIYGPGAVPDALVQSARDADKKFARVAHDDLRNT